MAESNHQTNNPRPIRESWNKQASQKSDVSPQAGKDISSGFWSTYERVANQYDEGLLNRYDNDLDALLIVAGLFSSVSSAFVVNMESSLSPNPSDTTNALLKILVNTLQNGTFPEQEAKIPIWRGPGYVEIWIQTLAYTSLSTSLLAGFGAVMGKQSLGHYKTSRFGPGALHERCIRRQQKLDGLEAWHFSTVIATLRVFLQLSLLFFGIAQSANVWIQQHTISSVTMGTTAFGVTLYFLTFVASLKWPECPFQTPLSTVTRRTQDVIRRKWEQCPKYWACFLGCVRRFLRNTICHGKKILITRISTQLSRIFSVLRRDTHFPVNDPEASSGPELSASESAGDSEPSPSSDELDLGFLDSPIEPVGARTVQWLIKSSTDAEIIFIAASIVPEVEWPHEYDDAFVLDRLKGQFYACFDSTRHLHPLTQERAVAYLKALYHFCYERNLRHPFWINTHGGIYSSDDLCTYQIPRDPGFLTLACAVDDPNELDITRLAMSDRMWMAHMFTYRLHENGGYQALNDFVINFIHVCLPDLNSPDRLAADCLLLAGLLIGLRIDRRTLTRLDKSAAIGRLLQSVLNRIRTILLGPVSPQHEWDQNALKLAQGPLLQELDHNIPIVMNCDPSMILKACFSLLEEDLVTEDRDKFRSGNVTILLHWNALLLRTEQFEFGLYVWHTSTQFDLLVDYHIQICEGTNYDAISNTFVALAALGGSPRTHERMRLYVETMIQFLDPERPPHVREAALHAACVVRVGMASMGWNDESLRERFSRSLASWLLDSDPATQQQQASITLDNPMKNVTFLDMRQHFCYLTLLCTLSQEPAWRGQLGRNGHFNNCLAIAIALLSQKDDYLDNIQLGAYAVYVTHIIAIVDAFGDEHEFPTAVHAYPIRSLVLKAWHFIFSLDFFEAPTKANWEVILTTVYLKALPSLVAYARRRWSHGDETDRLVALVEQVCHKLDEQDIVENAQKEATFGHQGIPVLGKQIRDLVDSLQLKGEA